MAIARSIEEEIQRSSWIRKMFETGRALKDKHGADNVFDFSLGSPFMEPPAEFVDALKDLVNNPRPGMHRYMPNAGFPSTRGAVAELLRETEGVPVSADDIVMTVGAAGAINVAMFTILDPGDEVIILAPYFVEYLFYVANHSGVVKTVDTTEDFDLDLEAIEAAIGERTKAIIINTPNNPSGRIYSDERMRELGDVLQRAEQRYNKRIYVICDTPYARITYDGAVNPRLMDKHPSTLVAHSYSKELGLAGERIGYLAISPEAPDRALLQAACPITNRTLGFINAPALMQLAIERALRASVDLEAYAELRRVMCDGLEQAGYSFFRPQGAFYIFLRTPVPDDIAFTRALQQENVLVVPGSGFGRAGHVRIAFCVTRRTIEGAIPLFAEALERVRSS